MFACLLLTGWAETVEAPQAALLAAAREFSPRVEAVDARAVVADLHGVARLFGDAPAVGDALRRTLADRGLRARIAVAGTRTAARLLAHGRAGLTIVPPGHEAVALAELPLDLLAALVEAPAPRHRGPVPSARFYRTSPVQEVVRPRRSGKTTSGSVEAEAMAAHVATLRRWGLRRLGELAALPAADVAARLGAPGPALQRLARGEDEGPLVPLEPDERFESTLALEWPVEGLEPLSFVLGRLLEPLCARLDVRGRAAATLSVALRLVTRDTHTRRLDLPAPIKDARTLRTLALLDLESHPPAAGIDAVTVTIEPTPARVLQFSLLARARPSAEQVSTLLARLGALMGQDRVGAPALLESHRPGAFAMTRFTGEPRPASAGQAPVEASPMPALRRYRHPVAIRVTADEGCPVRLETARTGVARGLVTTCAGPWRTSGEWWHTGAGSAPPWDRDEWDVALADGSVCRIFRDRQTGGWFVEGTYD